MKNILAIICLLFSGLVSLAQEYNFQTQDLQLTINEQGSFTDLTICGKSVLSESTPILLACQNGDVLLPTRFEALEGQQFNVAFDAYGNVVLKLEINDYYLKFSIIEQSDFDAVILFPVHTVLVGSIGEVIGVVQGNGLAFGIQTLNPKTEANFPPEYASKIEQLLHYKASPSIAAVKTSKGAIMQFSARDRSKKEFRNVLGIDEVMVMPIKGEEARIEGAAIAMFGCHQNVILNRIGKIEDHEALPHPSNNGMISDRIWDKTDLKATKSYLICEYTDKDAHFVHEKCRQANLDLGYQVFANRIATNSRYVTPKPSKHLLRQGVLKLNLDIAADQTFFAVYDAPLFNRPAHINILQIGNELISYRAAERTANIQVLYDCTRGAFGTKKTAHSENETVYKLWDHYDRTLVPDLEIQDSLCLVMAKRSSTKGSPLLVFNDLMSYCYNGHGDLALSHFLGTMLNNGNANKRFQADEFTHYSWHYLARVNDNTVWNESMRTKFAEILPEKQDYYRRNLMPWMLGNFEIHPADKMRKATTLEELEWFLSKAAAYEVGFGLDFSVEAMRKHGQTDEFMNTINLWENLRLSQAFSQQQKEDFKDPFLDWHIEKTEDSTYLLYPQHISRRFFCNLTDDQWTWNSPYKSHFALRIAVEGKGSISELNLRTPNGTLYLPCAIKAGQYLIYDFDGTAYITDINYNKIKEVAAQGMSVLDEGSSDVSFSCEVKTEEKKSPQVTVRYITRGQADLISNSRE